MAGATLLFGESEKSSNAIIRLLNSRAAGSPRAYEEAAKIVRKDAEKGGILQKFVLAAISRDADAPEAARMSESERECYFSSSRERIRKLAELNDNPLAWYVLSMEANDFALLEKAAAGGNVQALNAFGTMRLTAAMSDANISSNELDRIQKRVYKCFKWASDQGDINGFYNLGMCLMNGYGCKQDMKMAFDCFRTAAEAGHPEAINNLGGFFRDGIVVGRNLELSVLWFKKSGELGNDYGAMNYALAQLMGEGVKRDESAAVQTLRHLAERRANAESMYFYGKCLLYGRGVAKDEESAFRWFVKSAEDGFAMAMNELAHCYEQGVGVKPDTGKSLYWNMRARAESGDRAAADWLKGNGK